MVPVMLLYLCCGATKQTDQTLPRRRAFRVWITTEWKSARQRAARRRSEDVQSPYPAQPADPYYGGYPEYSGAPAGGIDIKDLLGIARRRRSVILTTVLVVTSLAVLAGLLLTPKYTATALVMINPQQSKVLNLQDVMSGLSTDASTIESQIKLIKSEAQNDHLMETLGLYDDPDYNVALQNPDSTVQQRFAGPFATLVSWVPDSWLVAAGLADEAGSEAFGDVPELQRFRSLERFMDNLKVTQEGRSYVINIGFKSPNAQKAAWVANKAAELYVQARSTRSGARPRRRPTGWARASSSSRPRSRALRAPPSGSRSSTGSRSSRARP